MSTAKSHDSAARPQTPPPDVAVMSWPLRQAPLNTLVTLGVISVVAVLTAWFSQSAPMGALVQAVFMVALWRLWTPVTYELGGSGVVEKALGRRRRVDWLAIMRVQVQAHGVLLLADHGDVPLARMHGIDVPWQDKRQEILALIEYFVFSRIEFSRESRPLDT